MKEEKQKRPYIVAITGRSGSGKTTLGSYYAAQGYPVLDGDQVSRDVTGPGSSCLNDLVETFGADILRADGSLDRRGLAAVAFASPQMTAKLTAITHPYIVQAILDWVDSQRSGGNRLVFVDGAVIIGGPFQPYCDRIILLLTQRRLSVSRIILRDSISKIAAAERLDAQLPEEMLRQSADYVIENNSSADALRQKGEKVLRELLREFCLQDEETGSRCDLEANCNKIV